jgi:DNA-binding Lrp family transcriptional regulator
MKNIQSKLILLLKDGYCTPQISRIAKATDEPAATIHYNIQKLKDEGSIKAYKAVFDHRKINESFCSFVLIALSSKEYSDPEKIARRLSKHREIESVDVLAGEWELIMKVRTRDQDEYYDFMKNVISKEEGIRKTKSIISLKQVKTEYVQLG